MTDVQEKPFDREKYLASTLKEGVAVKGMVDSANETLKNIIEVAAEKLDMPKQEVRALITKNYVKIYDPEKYNKDKDLAISVYDTLDGVEK